ncbi:MAG: hypothetical protein COA43_12270 [Robiginitomaculum sp.]|nr:MAG: hypothetical protein COA43_12270 [Robiginitomaculum sp.]
MRIIMCSVAAIALSGCSWMGFGSGTNGSHGSYSPSASTKCCVGGDTLSTWNLEGAIGKEFIVGGDALTGSQAHTGFSSPTNALVDVSMKDAYSNGKRASLGGSYALNPNRKVSLQGFYSKASGNEVVFGSQGGQDITGTMSDYKSYGVEAGLRQYFKPRNIPLLKSFRPYVEGRLGAAHVDDISLNGISQTVATSLNTPTSLAVYQGGWVPTATGLIGVETPVFKRMTLGLETGVQFTGKLKSDDSDKAAGTFNSRYAGFNNGGGRVVVPLTLRGRYRF